MSDSNAKTPASKKTRMPFPTAESRQQWHKDNCPCKGNARKISDRLEARINAFDSSQTKTNGGFHRPGSQNRNK